MSNLLSNSKLYLKRKAPTLLTFAGATGVVTTTIMAVKATPKAVKLLEEAEKDKGCELSTFEKVKVAAPIYIPTAVVGLSTVFCIFGANTLNKNSQAAITSAYALLDSSYKEYKSKFKELYGDEANEKVESEIAESKYPR